MKLFAISNSRRLLALMSAVLCGGFITGCSLVAGNERSYLESGTIILSLEIPSAGETSVVAASDERPLMAPLIGYIPPTAGFVPAENETWMEIDRGSKQVIVYRGKEPVKEMRAEGEVPLEPGVYALQHKQKKPLWYAPDEYFRRRHLAVPKSNDRLRYRRGALGPYVLYPTTTFPIHSAALWSEDVGGLRLSKADLASVYYMLPVGSSIVVK